MLYKRHIIGTDWRVLNLILQDGIKLEINNTVDILIKPYRVSVNVLTVLKECVHLYIITDTLGLVRAQAPALLPHQFNKVLSLLSCLQEKSNYS